MAEVAAGGKETQKHRSMNGRHIAQVAILRNLILRLDCVTITFWGRVLLQVVLESSYFSLFSLSPLKERIYIYVNNTQRGTGV